MQMTGMTLLAYGMAMVSNLLAGPWVVVDDVVMGGRSASRAVVTEEGLNFEGKLSLENNGGFGSIRRAVDRVPDEARGVRLRVRGDGRTYQLRLRQDRGFDGVAWRVEFESTEDWREIEVPFDAFEPVFRGRPVPGAGPFVPAKLGQIGFLIADKQPGAFRLQVGELSFY
jgi:monofunctional biosynthetic peptidoglycan transglycosylase